MFLLLFGVIGIDDALIIGGLMAGGTMFGSWMGNRNSKKQISRDAFLNYAYGLQMAENGPSASVKGLRKAGLNPILAATDGSFSTPKMPSVSGSGAPNGAETGTAMANLALNTAQTKSNVKLAETQESLNKASTFKSFADGLTTLKTGGLKGGYAALKSFASDFLGIRDKDTSDLLKSFGFGPDTVSTPDGSSRPRSEVVSRSTAGDGKDLTSPVSGVDMPDKLVTAMDDRDPNKPYFSSRRVNHPVVASRFRRWDKEAKKEAKEAAIKAKKEALSRRAERNWKYHDSFQKMPRVRRFIYR